jgi:hypothetical protein
MARDPAGGDWLLIEELLERGDPAFVDELRRVHDVEALAAFAGRWWADRRPTARRLLLEYLERPLNAYRHEALVKRLFKHAEADGDDPVMARFLVLFDRSIRRERRRRRHYESRTVADRREALALAEAWRAQGYEPVHVWEDWRKQFIVYGARAAESIIMPPGTTMPRGRMVEVYDPATWGMRRVRLPDWAIALRLDAGRSRDPDDVPAAALRRLERFRLFSVATRHYLRRRAWRYFRRLGRRQPERYVAAVSEALRLYNDDDVADGLALIDNWGLVHILFHFSPALEAKRAGWRVAAGHSLAELEPAPMFGGLWKSSPRAVADLLLQGRCRPVRQWAMRILRRDPAVRAAVSLEEWLGLLSHDDPEVVALAAELLREAEGLGAIGAGRWLALVESASPAALEVVAELAGRHIRPEDLTLDQVVRLASSRPLPLARLGLAWLRGRAPRDEAECRALLGLVEAEADPVRPELVRQARGALSASPWFRPEWVLDYLDSRHADVRAEGWAWFRDEPRVRDDATTWRRLLESPYDDVRLALVAELEARAAGREPAQVGPIDLDPEALRLLWATVLLNIHRGSRAKPVVVRQLLRRAERRPEELPLMLPLLGVALRSARGPEWRDGLAAVVRLVERRADAAPLVRAAFPELQWA